MKKQTGTGAARRTVFITGGLGGIGLACALRFAAEGANLVLADLQLDNQAAAIAACRGAGAGAVLALACDVADAAQVEAACQTALQRFGSLDVAVNVAGMMLFKPLQQFSSEDWQRVLGVNLLGPAHLTRQWLLHAAAGAAIVNIASVHAQMTTALVAPYAAAKAALLSLTRSTAIEGRPRGIRANAVLPGAKAALLSLTRSTAIEGRPRGIRANAVLPGAIDTPMLWSNPNLQSGAETVAPEEVGTPDDVAAAVVFLASDNARFITGATLEVSGGRLARL